MVALIVGLFAPVGLTVFTVGMERFQRRMERPGTKRDDSLAAVPEAGVTPAPASERPSGVPTGLRLA
ncbi:hypothetical protein [Gordonia metallireducens]|uniref:hypothetical protein n=1 Tax=Gordonia metallireducens TaxID=2897779 RepID=UPI001E621DB2|nr:hypothetical protein [Gordonia metallireducens]